MRSLPWLGILLLAISIGYASNPVQRHHPPGILIAGVPQQGAADGARPWKKNEYLIRPLATFKIDARVLLTAHYSWDRESELAPVDLTLGWGPLSDSAVLDTLNISHGYRHYRWRAHQLMLPVDQINDHMANMHIVPADSYVEGKLRKVVPGDLVSIEGFLIEAATAQGWSWRSSLTRTDSGHGACEVVWAEKISVR